VLISVVIPNYNYARYLGAAVDSALGQTHSELEVIVVDDGSTDDSREILAGYGDRVRVLLQENAGQLAAVNAGVAASRGEIVCLLDSDDVFLAEKVARVEEAFRRAPSPSLVYHQVQTVAADGRTELGNPMPRGVWSGDIRERVERAGGFWSHPTTSALSFSRAFLERVMPLPSAVSGPYVDTFLASIAAFSGPVVGIAQPLALFRLHGENTWSQGPLRQSQAGAEMLGERRDQILREFEALKVGLRDRLGIQPEIALDDHPQYQRYRRAAGEAVPVRSVIAAELRCPSVPWSMRWREAVKIALGRL
jgi:hypothetical protein